MMTNEQAALLAAAVLCESYSAHDIKHVVTVAAKLRDYLEHDLDGVEEGTK